MWDSVANLDIYDTWSFLRDTNVPVNDLDSCAVIGLNSVLIACKSCIMEDLPLQHETIGSCWWKDTKAAEECGLHEGNIKQEVENQLNSQHLNGAIEKLPSCI
ncbi:hypothetical protein EZV62_020638 [Acer yangbiense]|uniref:Uncharacterized protein n=1 Tax=Acer yangbiense TaxID=1000413 RepID=A0A5C7HGA4_9ROSI|nr:hypothetical protein EZV62_020638 [Acer yangbiense]